MMMTDKADYRLGKIDAKLDILVEQNQKTILALIALVAATVGLKFIGSPPLQIILFYVKTFIFVFTMLIAWQKRHEIKGWYYIFGFGMFAGIAQVLNIALQNESMFATTSFLLCNIMLLLFIWQWDKHSNK